MTYKQIEQIEGFIKDVNELKDNSAMSSEFLYKNGKVLHEKICATRVGYSVDINWGKCAFSGYGGSSTAYFLDEIKSNLEVMLSALQGVLDAVTCYPYIVEIRKDIEKGKKIKNGDDKENFIIEISIKYQGKIDFGKNIQEFKKSNDLYLINDETDAIFKGVIQKLNLYLTEICEEKKVVRTQSQFKQPIIQVNQNQNVNQNQETNVNISFLFEDCFKALDDCETLDEIETQEIKAQLQEIQGLLKDKKGRKKSIKSKIGSVLKWVAEKGSDVMLAVLPVLLQSLQGL